MTVHLEIRECMTVAREDPKGRIVRRGEALLGG